MIKKELKKCEVYYEIVRCKVVMVNSKIKFAI
jgi:hypothetical protein